MIQTSGNYTLSNQISYIFWNIENLQQIIFFWGFYYTTKKQYQHKIRWIFPAIVFEVVFTLNLVSLIINVCIKGDLQTICRIFLYESI